MHTNSSTTTSMARFMHRILALLLLAGVGQYAAMAAPNLRKLATSVTIDDINVAPKKAATLRKASPARAASAYGISFAVTCDMLTDDDYAQYGGASLSDYYLWYWNKGVPVTHTGGNTVLTYNANETPYFYFEVNEGGEPLEAIKIYLETSLTNNATFIAGYYDQETGTLYETPTEIVSDYENGIVYWKPDGIYDLTNIFFYLTSGEINMTGFEIYSQGNTPDDFLGHTTPGVKVDAPVFDPAPCTFTEPMSVQISANEGNSIYFTTDGSTPVAQDACRYNGPVVISSTTTFKAIAVDAEGNQSSVATATYRCTRHGIGEGYNPESPSNPGGTPVKSYRLTALANPTDAGSIYTTSDRYEPGEQVNLYCYNNQHFTFRNWTIDGTVVSTQGAFTYIMPEYDVTIFANFDYNPDGPGNPSPLDQVVKHPVAVRTIPSHAASVSPSGAFDMPENSTRYVYAYPNNGWILTGWTINGEQQPQTTSPLNITMGQQALDIAAYFTYNPVSPSNPEANYYNPSTGQVIIDDFIPGYLYNALDHLVGYSNFANVSQLIVKGQLASNDLGIVSYIHNAGTIDLSRTGGVTVIPGYLFEQSGAATIVLPSTITSVGGYAFSGCKNLTSLVIYAQEPPQCARYTFSEFPNKENCTLYVPASAIELYAAAEGWKDFTILPITNDAHVLQVNLPADAADGRYKHNSIEIVNINSGVRQKYVVSDRLLYTFNGLQKDEQYNIYMFSQAGLEIGRIENVVIPDQDMEVTFDNLKSLHTVYAKVVTADGSDVTDQVTVEWLKPLADGTTTYLRKAVSLGEIPHGQQLVCRVTLDDRLGVAYAAPADVEFTVADGDNTCNVTLAPFRQVELSGIVADGDGSPLAGASVSATQTLNGRFPKTYTARTDRQGAWSLTVLDAPETRLTFAAAECVNAEAATGAFEPSETSRDMGKTTLRSIVGARVTYGFTYHEAGSEEAEEYYADYQNVVIDVFNITQNRAHADVSMQYPVLAVLDENIATGDRLRLTARSKTGAFNPVEQVVAVDDTQRAQATFDIVSKGGIAASFEMTDNPAVTAMLYSSQGQLLKKLTYSEAKATFTGLDDGAYTLVTMGQSDLMNSILRLDSFGEIGLTEGKDYVKNAVTVESGTLTQVKNSEIPAFDESLFYYTTPSTNFSTNKSSITTGNFLTLRSAIDFKGVYKPGVSNVALVVDLPQACDLVEQSVIQGPNLLPYTIDNGRLTVQLGSNYTSQVRFCVVPTTGGTFNATASVVFDYDGRTLTQPLGTATSTIKNLDFIVPAIINSEKFQVNGMAPGNSQIEVYENGTLIGNAHALANGTWAAECTLPKTYNFTAHTINAIITTKEGIKLTSESVTVELDRGSTSPKTVLMTFYNGWLRKNVDVTFDFTNLTIDNPSYMFYTKTKLTFVADFTDNNPERLSDVTLWTLASDNTETMISMSYDATSDKWIGSHDFDYYTAPVNIALEYSYAGQTFFDRRQFSDHMAENESIITDNIAERAEFIAEYDAETSDDEVWKQLDELFSQEEPDEEEISRLLNLIGWSDDTTGRVLTDDEFEALSQQADESWANWEANGAPSIRDMVLADYFADPDFDPLSDYEIISELEGGIKTVSKKKLASVNTEELVANGYSAITLDDGSAIYVLYGDNLMEFIDCTQLVKYSIIVEPSVAPTTMARANAPVMPGSYLYYATAAKNAIQAIYTLSNTDKRRWLVDAAQKIHEATEGISNFYEAFMTDFTNNIQTAYNGLSVLCDYEIEKQEALAEAARERTKGYNAKINDKKTLISLYESERKEVFSSTTLSEERKQALLKELDDKIKNTDNDISSLKKKRNDDWEVVKKAEKKVKKIKKQSGLFRKTHTKIRETLDKFPKRLAKGLRMPKVLRVCGKVAGELGVPLQCWSLFNDMIAMADDINDWIPLMDRIDAHHCYKKEDPDAIILHESIYDRANWHAWHNVGILSTEIGAIGFSIAGGVPGSPTWWAEMGLSVAAEWWKYFNDKASLNDRTRFWQQVGSLKCDDKDDDNDPKRPHKPKKRNYQFNPANPFLDPSGYVYEAVPANRVEGVQATIYYKETKEDMYGDPYEEVVLWNAEEYAQENPLFTDENGMYRWDVPQGLWQVKFEKDGYVTAYSEWLPVPPPQLDVNIGIVQNKQPEVTEARAYEEGVEVQFDKFMDPSTLTPANIYVTAGGEKLNGEISIIDSSLADEFAQDDDADAARYASRIRFVPEQPLSVTTGEIRLTVSRNVLSYAGIPMTETFSQVLDVEKEVQVIAADDVKVLYGGEKEVTVYALPYEAAVGRTLHIANSSDLIATVDLAETTLDDEGKAVIKVKGDLPGRAQLTFTIDDVTATGQCAVDVVTEIITAEAPRASRASGTAVYRGSKIELATDSKDAVIYFTTDGSCPCDENGTRRKYTVPIIINDDMQILAITSVGNGGDDVSETVEFNYTLKRSDMDFKMDQGWTWISHNFEKAVAPTALVADPGVTRILSQTQEVVRDPQLGMVGTLTELSADKGYKVEASAATTRQRLSDFAWNPATPIHLTPGWNWLGYPVSQTMSVDEALAPTDAETLDIVVGQTGFAQFDGENWVGTLETMSPGQGYMYQSQSAKDVVYNTSIVSTAAPKSVTGIAGNLPLALDIHKYASAMPVIATLTGLDGCSLDNASFQTVAFSGTECRGIGRVVNGLVMMNVYGEPGDKVTFQATDTESGVCYNATTTLDFGEKVVGDIFTPHAITLNTMSGITDAGYSGNVKVSVNGDMLRIKGIAASDIELVEIYGMDGQKLFRETSVAESGIRVSAFDAGAYVVVVKGNGEYTYHKIVIR